MAEWDDLVAAVGGYQTAGTKLKATNGWKDLSNGDNCNGTDEYGFSALPGGDRHYEGIFMNAGEWGAWWTATKKRESDEPVRDDDDIVKGEDYDACIRAVDGNYGQSVYEYRYHEDFGFPVRCVCDD
jgi:uncharacterized protein (TIGR02145 family)